MVFVADDNVVFYHHTITTRATDAIIFIGHNGVVHDCRSHPLKINSMQIIVINNVVFYRHR